MLRPDRNATVRELVRARPASTCFSSPVRLAVMAWVPMAIADKKPPIAQNSGRLTPIPATPSIPVLPGNRPTMAVSRRLMAVCDSMAKMTGPARTVIFLERLTSTENRMMDLFACRCRAAAKSTAISDKMQSIFFKPVRFNGSFLLTRG